MIKKWDRTYKTENTKKKRASKDFVLLHVVWKVECLKKGNDYIDENYFRKFHKNKKKGSTKGINFNNKWKKMKWEKKRYKL